MATPRRRVVALVAVAFAATACAGVSRTGQTSASAARARAAEDALQQDDFVAARDDLAWLASRCEAGTHRRRALLLLAATDLDPANPMFSPRESARASAAFIVTPEVDGHELPVARALYRLATELGGLAYIEASEEDATAMAASACVAGRSEGELRPLPALPTVGPATRVQVIEAKSAAQSDSLALMRTQTDSLRSELRRISDLLREGTAPALNGNE